MAKAKPTAPEAPPAAPEVEQIEQPVVEKAAEPVAAVKPTPGTIEQSEAQEEAPPAAPEFVKARVLAHCAHGKPDDVIELDAALAKTLEGVVDTNPAAVAYAESLK